MSGIHGYGTLVLFVVLCLFVFVHLLKHRYGIAPDDTTRQSIRLILRNHGDFFLPLLVAVVCSLPMIIIAEMMTCTKASQLEALPYLILVFGNILGVIPTGFTFFYYIYPANVYLTAFWTDSPVGRCLRKIKTLWTARNWGWGRGKLTKSLIFYFYFLEGEGYSWSDYLTVSAIWIIHRGDGHDHLVWEIRNYKRYRSQNWRKICQALLQSTPLNLQQHRPRFASKKSGKCWGFWRLNGYQ